MNGFKDVMKRVTALTLVLLTIATTYENDLITLAGDMVLDQAVVEEVAEVSEPAPEAVIEAEAPAPETVEEQTPSESETVITEEEEVVEPTEVPTETPVPTEEPEVTDTPTPTPTETPTPSPTLDPAKHKHVDENKDYICDDEECGKILEHKCVAKEGKCECKYCEEEMEHVDDNNDGYCDICNEIVDEELAHKIKLNPHTLHATAGNFNITIKGNLPDGSYAQASLVYNTAQVENLIENETDEKVQVVAAVDVTIYDADHNVFQPEDFGETVSVTISNLDIEKPSEVNVYRVNDNNSVDEIGTNAVSGSEVEFEAEHFTIYAVTLTADEIVYPDNYMRIEDIKQTIEVSNDESNPKVNKYHKITTAKLQIFVPKTETFSPKAWVTAGGVTNEITSITKSENSSTDSGKIYTVTINLSNVGMEEITGGERASVTFSPGNAESNLFAINPYYANKTANYSQWYEIGDEYYEEDDLPMSLTMNVSDYPSNAGSLKFNVADGHAVSNENRAVYMKDESGSIEVTLENGRVLTNKPSQVGSSIEDLKVLNGKLVFKAKDKGVTELKYTINGQETVFAIEVIEVTVNQNGSSKYGDKDAMVPEVLVDNGNGDTAQIKNTKWTAVKTATKRDDYMNLSATTNANVSFTYKGVTFSTGYVIEPLDIDADDVIGTTKALVDMFKEAAYEVDNTSPLQSKPVKTFMPKIYAQNQINPVLGTDFTATAKRTGASSSGVKYAVTIKGKTNGNYTLANPLTFEVTVSDGSQNAVADSFELRWINTPSYEYKGSDYNPFEDGDLVIYNKPEQKEIKYTDIATSGLTIISASSNPDAKNVGEKTFSIQIEGFDGALTTEYRITEYDLENVNVVSTVDSDLTKLFTGIGLTLESGDGTITLSVDGMSQPLTENTDYKLTYEDNVTAGHTAKVYAEGINNFKGKIKVAEFKIANNLSKNVRIRLKQGSTTSTVTSPSADGVYKSSFKKSYNGETIKPYVAISFSNGETIFDNAPGGTDKGLIDVGYYDDEDCTEVISAAAGTKYVKITGKGLYDNIELKASYIVEAVDIANLTFLETTNTSFVYDGTIKRMTCFESEDEYTSATVPGYMLADNVGNILELGEDFDCSEFKQSDAKSDIAYTLKGKGNYTGIITSTYTISPLNISAANNDPKLTISLLDYNGNINSEKKYDYTGSAITPKVKITYGTETINEAANTYQLTDYKNNTNRGVDTGKFTIKGVKNLTGERTVTFTIGEKTLDYSDIEICLTDSNGEHWTSYNEEKGAYIFSDSDLNFVYNGSEQKPDSVQVWINNRSQKLSAGSDKDYTLSRKTANDNFKNASVDPTTKYTITFVNNYKLASLINIQYRIKPAELTEANLKLDLLASNVQKTDITGVHRADNEDENKYYFFENINPRYVVDSSRNKTLALNSADYNILVDSNATKPGKDYEYKITGEGNYTGTVTGKYTIGTDITGAKVTLYNPATNAELNKNASGQYVMPYLGTAEPIVKVGNYNTDDFNIAREGSSGNNTDIYHSHGGTNVVTCTITGKNNELSKLYYATSPLTVSYLITQQDISGTNFEFNDLTYSKSTVMPAGDQNSNSFFYTGNIIDVAIEGTYKGENLADNAITFKSDESDPTLLAQQGTFKIVNKGESYAATVKDINDYNLELVSNGDGDFKGTAKNFIYHVMVPTQEFIDKPENDDMITITIPDQQYTGGKISPNESTGLEVFFGKGASKKQLHEGADKDYTLKWETRGNYNNTSISPEGQYTGVVQVVFTGTYVAKNAVKEGFFKITKVNDKEKLTFTVSNNVYKGTTNPSKPEYEVKLGDKTLVEGTDYDINWNMDSESGDDYLKPGKHKVKIVGKGDYLDGVVEKECTYYTLLSLASDYVKVIYDGDQSSDGVTFNTGYEIETNKFKVYYYPQKANDITKDNYDSEAKGGVEIEYDWEFYSVEPEKLGAPSVSSNIIFKGNFTGNNDCYVTKQYKYPIKIKGSLSGDDISIEITNATAGTVVEEGKTIYRFNYTGSEIRPNISVKSGSYDLIEGTHYDITPYTPYVEPQSGADITLHISGTGLFEGTSEDILYRIVYNLDDTNTKLVLPDGYEYQIDNSADGIKPPVKAIFGSDHDVDCNISPWFNVEYARNKEVGNKTASATVSSNSKWVIGDPRQVFFTIKGLELTKDNIIVNTNNTLPDKTYTGGAITQELEVKYGGNPLEKDTDYYVSYVDNVKPGTAKLYLYGKGSYYTAPGGLLYTFKIEKANIQDAEVTITEEAVYDGGNRVKPVFEVTYNGMKLASETNYTVSETDYTNGYTVGPATLKINGAGDFYTGTKTINYEVKPLDLNQATVNLEPKEKEFTGQKYDLNIDINLVTKSGKSLVKGTHYEWTVNEDKILKDKGTYLINIVSSPNSGGNCIGSQQVPFDITARDLEKNYNDGVVEIVVPDMDRPGTYDKTITITDKGRKREDGGDLPEPYRLTADDYDAFFFKTDKSGDGTVSEEGPYVEIKGKGNYEGSSVKIGFKIGKNINENVSVSFAENSVTYDANEHVPVVTGVERDGQLLDSTKDYSVQYFSDKDETGEYYGDDFVNAGTKYAVITGLGDYYGTVVATFDIVAKKVIDGNLSVKLGDGSDWVRYYFDASGNVTKKENKYGVTDKVYSVPYNGNPVEPTVHVYDVKEGNGQKTEFEVDASCIVQPIAYSDNSNYTGRDAHVELKLQRNYADGYTSIRVPFRVEQRDLNGDIDGTYSIEYETPHPENTFRYEGKAVDPKILVKFKDRNNIDKTLVEGRDYRVTYENDLWPGTATIKVEGINGYKGTVTRNYDIVALLDEHVHFRSNGTELTTKDEEGYLKLPTQLNNGTAPKLESFGLELYLVADNGEELVVPQTVEVNGKEKSNYLIELDHHSDSFGKVTIKKQNSGYYDGTITLKYEVNNDLTGVYAIADSNGYKYTGGAIEPDFTFKRGDDVVYINYNKEDVKYYYRDGTEVENNKAINAGDYSASLRITIGNNSRDLKDIHFKIVPRDLDNQEDLKDITIQTDERRKFIGTNVEIKPPVTLKVGDKVIPADEYDVSYYNNKLPTKEGQPQATIVITGKGGNLTGTTTKEFTIYILRPQNLRSTNVGSNRADLHWEIGNDPVTGYYIKQVKKFDINGVQTDVDDTNVSTWTVAGHTSGNAFQLAGLEGNSTYVYSVQPYLVYEGVIYEGDADYVTVGPISPKTILIDVTSTTSGQVRIYWGYPDNDDIKVDRYTIRRYETGKKSTTDRLIASFPATYKSFVNRSLQSGKDYTYYVIGTCITDTGSAVVSTSTEQSVTVK